MQPLWTPPLLNAHEGPLLQEQYFPDRWKMLICCVLLNLTSRKQVEPMLNSFFDKYPDPKSLDDACDNELKKMIKPLGMSNKRSQTLKRFSREYLEGQWTKAIQLHGIGKYGSDSDRIFFLGEWESVQPRDGALVYYKGFLQNYFETLAFDAV